MLLKLLIAQFLQYIAGLESPEQLRDHINSHLSYDTSQRNVEEDQI